MAIAGGAWLVFFKGKTEEDSEIEGSSSSRGVSTKSLQKQHPLVTKLYELSLEDKKDYFSNLDDNLTTDGYDDMTPKQKIEVIYALIDVDLYAFRARGWEFTNEYAQYCGNIFVIINWLPVKSDSDKQMVSNLKDIVAYNNQAIRDRASYNFIDSFEEQRSMLIQQKYSYLRMSFDNNYSLHSRRAQDASEFLIATGYVNLKDFRESRVIDKQDFAQKYRAKICSAWEGLTTRSSESRYKAFHMYSLHTADQLDRIAKENIADQLGRITKETSRK